MEKVLDCIRMIGLEFADVTDDTLINWIDLTKNLVSKKQFAEHYEIALAYLVCHKLKMAGYGVDALGGLGVPGAGFTVGSVSEGGSSVSFTTNASSNVSNDAELGMTVYGTQFLHLRKIVIIPIHCGGAT